MKHWDCENGLKYNFFEQSKAVALVPFCWRCHSPYVVHPGVFYKEHFPQTWASEEPPTVQMTAQAAVHIQLHDPCNLSILLWYISAAPGIVHSSDRAPITITVPAQMGCQLIISKFHDLLGNVAILPVLWNSCKGRPSLDSKLQRTPGVWGGLSPWSYHMDRAF